MTATYTPDDDDRLRFLEDRFKRPSLLLRNRFAVRYIQSNAGAERPGLRVSQSGAARLYRALFDQTDDLRLRYRLGPRRPSYLVVARNVVANSADVPPDSTAPSTLSCVGEGSCEITPGANDWDLRAAIESELWGAASWEERREAYAAYTMNNFVAWDDFQRDNPGDATLERAYELFPKYICEAGGRPVSPPQRVMLNSAAGGYRRVSRS